MVGSFPFRNICIEVRCLIGPSPIPRNNIPWEYEKEEQHTRTMSKYLILAFISIGPPIQII
jgi:hypothetical protein